MSASSAQTFVQKALARAAGRTTVEVGEVVDVRPDIVLSHDNTAAIRRIWQQFGQDRVVIPERMAITLDHAVPAPTTQHAQNHAEIRRFVAEQGIARFYEVGRGICHQVLSEEAVVLPGQMILGADSHTPHFGWLGAFGAGIGRSEVAALWATGELWLRVPESIRIVLEGDLPPGVTAKDFALRIIGDLGADGGLYASVEFSGSGIEALSIESRMVLPNMMAEFGAKNAYIAPDAETFDYLTARLLDQPASAAAPGYRFALARSAPTSLPTPSFPMTVRRTAPPIGTRRRIWSRMWPALTRLTTSSPCRRLPARPCSRLLWAPAPMAGWKTLPRSRRSCMAGEWLPVRVYWSSRRRARCWRRRWPLGTLLRWWKQAPSSACPVADPVWATIWVSPRRTR